MLASQKALSELQPKIEVIKKKYPKPEEQTKAIMELYRSEKVNPFSSCLPVLIQLPIFIAVYHVFQQGLQSQNLDVLYPFIHNPGSISPLSLGIIDLSQKSYVLPVLAGIAQFFQTRMLSTKKPPLEVAKEKGAQDENMAAMMNKQMLYMMPALTVFIGISLPSGLSLYWLVTTIFSIVQQYMTFRALPKPPKPGAADIVTPVDIIDIAS